MLVVLVSLAAGLVLYGFYNDYFSPEARAGAVNGRNIRHVRPGMDTTQVHLIMGPPQDRSRFTWPATETIYGYQHRPGTSNSYQITVNSSGKVKSVGILEE
jgi:outer membrane protein assembly factor BamE (lipoprotein component of BamABCDE complex)